MGHCERWWTLPEPGPQGSGMEEMLRDGATLIEVVNEHSFARCFLPSENQVPKKGIITTM